MNKQEISFFVSPATMKGEIFMQQNTKNIKHYILTEEEILAEYVKKDITDDFIFGKVMQKKDNCIDLLECLTGNKIESVNTIVCQKGIKITNESKGVRYDIYVEDNKDIMYDAEMQTYTEAKAGIKLPKRARFYQGMMDLNILEKGEDYRKLKESYVIFICTYDPFDRGLCCYNFENRCKDDTELLLNDGRKILIFNTKGTIINVSKSVVDLLHYIETKQVCNDFTKRLDDDVAKARQNREWMVEYMKTLVHDMDVRNEGIAQGEMIQLIKLVRKKIDKDKSVHTIAEELEESEDYIQDIYDAIMECGSEYSVEQVYEKLHSYNINN